VYEFSTLYSSGESLFLGFRGLEVLFEVYRGLRKYKDVRIYTEREFCLCKIDEVSFGVLLRDR
jgi:hypothetical protein